MSRAIGIVVDNVTYAVGIEYESMKRTFEIKHGSGKSSAVSGKEILDPIGLYYKYKLKLRCLPDNQAAYDSLFVQLAQPVYSHSITLPFGQRTFTFDAMVESGSDEYAGYYAGYHRWDELEITFTPANPVSATVLQGLTSAVGGNS